MKNLKLLLATFVFVVFFTACTNELDEWQAQGNTQQNSTELRTTPTTISLMSELNNFTLNNTNGIWSVCGHYWNKTYTNDSLFKTTNFKFSHTANSGWNYWDGFTVSNVADTLNYGTPTSSSGWLTHQWNCMAEYNCNTPRTNFLVGYWGYYREPSEITSSTLFSESGYSNWVKLGTSTQTYTVDKVTVAMSPWPYHGILYGDGFGRKFRKGDHFDLIIYGVKSDSTFTTPETYRLADYQSVGTTDSLLVMSKNWTDIELNFNTPVKYLVFRMATTDVGQYGPNTAFYFCLRDIEMMLPEE